MTQKICDLAWTKPAPQLLVAAGINAACLYVSQDTTGKNMTGGYVGSLSAAGLWAVTNFEYGASQMLGGYAQGVNDARLGLSQARACGMPPGRPIYYSADFDASSAQMAALVIPYLQGARSVTGPGTVGFYGGYPQVLAVLAFWAQQYPGERVYIWQTAAWSAGQWSAAADIRQQVAQETIGGAPVDIDYAYSADFGQWKPGIVPAGEDDMTPDQDNRLTQLFDYVFSGGTDSGPTPPGQPNNSLVSQLTWLQATVQSLVAENIPGELVTLESDVSHLGAPTIDPAVLAAAVKAALQDPAVIAPIASAVVAQIGADLKPSAG